MERYKHKAEHAVAPAPAIRTEVGGDVAGWSATNVISTEATSKYRLDIPMKELMIHGAAAFGTKDQCAVPPRDERALTVQSLEEPSPF